MVNLWGEYLFSIIVLNDDIAALSINKYFEADCAIMKICYTTFLYLCRYESDIFRNRNIARRASDWM